MAAFSMNLHAQIAIIVTCFGVSTVGSVHASPITACARWLLPTAFELREVEARALPYFEKVRTDPQWVANKFERGELAASQAIEIFDHYRKSSRWVQALNLKLASWMRSRPARLKASGVRGIGYRGYQWIRLWLPMLPDLARMRARRIYESALHAERVPFAKAWERLSASDRDFMKRWNLKADFERYVGDLQSGPRNGWVRLSRVRRVGRHAFWSVLLPSAIVATLALHASAHAHSQTLESALQEGGPDAMSRYDDAVELLIFDGLPTAGIRMAGHVYHFDTGNLSRLRLSDLGRALEDGELATADSFYRIPIELSDAQKELLQNRLESQVNRFYLYDGFDVNGMSMANQALQAVGGPNVLPVIDRSAAMTLAQLQFQHLFGDARIGRIRHVSNEPPRLGGAALESTVFLLHAGRLVWLGPILDHLPLTLP